MPVDLNALLNDSMIELANTNPSDSLATTQSMTKAIVAGANANTDALAQMTAVQTTAAQRADVLQQEAANASFNTAQDVLTMWNKTKETTALGIQKTNQYLQEAVALEAEATDIAAATPNLFANPIGAIAGSWKAASRRVDAQEKRSVASRMASSVNSMLQISRVQMEDALAAQGLQNNALLSKRAAELNAGLTEAKLAAENQYNTAITLDTANKELYQVKRDHIGWWQSQQGLLLQQQDAAMRKKEYDLKLKQWLADEKQRNMLEQNLQNVAYTIALTRKGAEPTQSEVIAARGMAEALLKQEPKTFGQFSMYGNSIKEHGSTLGFAQFAKTGTIGGVQALGQASGNAMYANFGRELFNQQYAANLEQMYQSRYKESGGNPQNTQAYEQWKRTISSGEKSSMEKTAIKTTQNTLADMSISEYIAYKRGNVMLPSSGINVNKLGDPSTVEAIYGYKMGSKENAALSNPSFKALLQNKQTTEGFAAGADAAEAWLRSAGIKNPYEVLARVYNAAAEGTILNSDPEYAFMRSYVSTKPKATVIMDNKPVNVADPVALERAVQLYRNPEKNIFQKAGGVLGDSIVGLTVLKAPTFTDALAGTGGTAQQGWLYSQEDKATAGAKAIAEGAKFASQVAAPTQQPKPTQQQPQASGVTESKSAPLGSEANPIIATQFDAEVNQATIAKTEVLDSGMLKLTLKDGRTVLKAPEGRALGVTLHNPFTELFGLTVEENKPTQQPTQQPTTAQPKQKGVTFTLDGKGTVVEGEAPLGTLWGSRFRNVGENDRWNNLP